MNTNTRRAIARFGAGAAVTTLAAALTLGAVSAASATGAAPIAGSNSYAVAADTVLTVSGANGVFSNDSDPEGDPISISQLVLNEVPMAGESLVPNNADGSFVYTPPTGFTGTRVWLYRVTDGTSESPVGAAAIVFTITGPIQPAANTAPVGVADAFSLVEDTFISVLDPGVLVNDSDADGDPLTVSSQGYVGSSLPGEGLTILANGGFSYTAPTGFTGVREWWYTVSDGTTDSAQIPITFTVFSASPNTAPVATPDVYPVTQDKILAVPAPGVLANDTDAESDQLMLGTMWAPATGLLPGETISVQGVGGGFTYMPPTGFTGTRQFTYTATDGVAESAVSTVTFTITAGGANTPPVASPDYYAVNTDAAVHATAPGVLGSDSDVDGDVLTVFGTTDPTGGTLPGESLVLNADGSFDYQPPTGYSGQRVWTYTVTDGAATADTNLVFTITPGPVANTAPVANADTYFVVKDMPFTRPGAGYLENDTDADGDALEWSNLYSPNGGLLPGEDLTMTAKAGAFVYTPPTGFTGVRVFSYLATDGTDLSNEATITFTVQAPGDGNPLIPTLPGDPEVPTPDDSTIPTGLASTGSTPSWMLGVLAAMVAATGFVLVRSSRRVA